MLMPAALHAQDASSPGSQAPPRTPVVTRPTPDIADRAASGRSLVVPAALRRVGSVYHVVGPNRLDVRARTDGVQTRPDEVVGFLIARAPTRASGDGTVGPVISAGQWRIPWSALLAQPDLDRWNVRAGGPLNIEQHPDVVVTVRNAFDTRLLTRSDSETAYVCTLLLDVTVNGITTERVVPRVVFSMTTRRSRELPGEATLRATWRLFLADFIEKAPGRAEPPTADIVSELRLSTQEPGDRATDTPARPDDSPRTPAPDQPAPDTPSAPPVPEDGRVRER